jgi:hypothetical protein
MVTAMGSVRWRRVAVCVVVPSYMKWGWAVSIAGDIPVLPLRGLLNPIYRVFFSTIRISFRDMNISLQITRI